MPKGRVRLLLRLRHSFYLRRQQDEEEELRRESGENEGLFVARDVASRDLCRPPHSFTMLHSRSTVMTA